MKLFGQEPAGNGPQDLADRAEATNPASQVQKNAPKVASRAISDKPAPAVVLGQLYADPVREGGAR
jgi:hypothetical protein